MTGTVTTEELRFPDVEGRSMEFDPSNPGCWVPICAADALPIAQGVAALLPGGLQVAVFRLPDGEVFAVSNADPMSGAMVMSRGIVGDRAGVPTVASPLLKQEYDLRTGKCFDDDRIKIARYPARVADGTVEVGIP